MDRQQTDRQTDRQMGKMTEWQKGKKIDIPSGRLRYRQTDRQTDRQTERKKDDLPSVRQAD